MIRAEPASPATMPAAKKPAEADRGVRSKVSRATTAMRPSVASAAGDTSAQFAHGFVNESTGAGIIPAEVHLDPLNEDAYTKEWCLGLVDATNINLTASSGGALAESPVPLTESSLDRAESAAPSK